MKDRRRASRALDSIRARMTVRMERQAMWGAILDALPAQIAIIDSTGTIVTVNRSWRRFAEDHGNPALKNAGPGDNYIDVCVRAAEQDDHGNAVRILTALRELLGGSRQHFSIEYPFTTEMGTRWFVMTAAAAEHRRQRNVVIAHVDVSETQLTAEAQGHFADLVRASPEAIIGCNLGGIVTSWNPAAEKMFGYTADEIIGEPMRILVPEDKMIEYEALVDALHAGVTVSVMTVRLARDGRRVPVALSVAAMRNAHDEVSAGVVIASDVSESRAMEARLEQAERLASLGRLAATMAHEFNNVLMGIQPFADMLARSSTDPSVQVATQHIRSSIQRGKAVTDEILRSTRQSAPLLQRVDVAQWLNDLSVDVRALLPASISCSIEVAPGTAAMCAEASQMSQVVLNLAINARDAMPQGGRLEIKAQTATDASLRAFAPVAAAGRLVQITVADSGSGIDGRTLPRIFEPLFTTKPHGTGLGLSIVHKIVKSHGGEIRVQTERGKGTRFDIFVPQATDTRSADRRGNAPEAGHRVRRRVLLVEDDETVASGLTLQLEAEGHDVAHVTTGQAVLPMIEKATPDIVVLDIGLPDVSGLTVYRALRERWPELPVIVSTAHAWRADILGDGADQRPHFDEDGEVVFLSKPYDVGVLLQSIQRLVR